MTLANVVLNVKMLVKYLSLFSLVSIVVPNDTSGNVNNESWNKFLSSRNDSRDVEDIQESILIIY